MGQLKIILLIRTTSASCEEATPRIKAARWFSATRRTGKNHPVSCREVFVLTCTILCIDPAHIFMNFVWTSGLYVFFISSNWSKFRDTHPPSTSCRKTRGKRIGALWRSMDAFRSMLQAGEYFPVLRITCRFGRSWRKRVEGICHTYSIWSHMHMAVCDSSFYKYVQLVHESPI